MTHVVTQSCCNDASCVYACPVNCIHPTPDEPDFATAEMLYIDPRACVDCGACVTACPVGAIQPHSRLGEGQLPFLEINSDFYGTGPVGDLPILAKVAPPLEVKARPEPPRVAIVGSGPAAMYAADEVLTVPGARVDVYEKLPTPYGLARAGVAPDHQETRRVTTQFDTIAAQPGFHLHAGVEVGADLTHEELLRHHHAVIYAVGASADRRLPVAGAERAVSATGFVAWYNGHPDHAHRSFDLSHRRAVVIGNGNVALDVARVLARDPEALAATDISPAALAALRESRIEEIVVAGRRGPAHSAFTLPELVGLANARGIAVSVPEADLDVTGAGEESHTVRHKLRLLRELAARDTSGARRRITLRYLLAPERITDDGVTFARNTLEIGDGLVQAVPTGETEHIEAGLVLTSIGYRALPVPGLPFNEATATVPNTAGRVEGAAATYVAGWIKRGPTGFIGTNKSCARETVAALVEDYNEGRLNDPAASTAALQELLRSRRPDSVALIGSP
ncbi:FAD-dependent oxidoreductase [Actinomadura hibisca]|uniref:FAD-dependent oxidoreductase n=1 Tax=Actinomadura hibisca TaxID=68565 RepID=UPI000834B259|nr:FAD-dependent oxidoreductase [Actinomadura hibisca]